MQTKQERKREVIVRQEKRESRSPEEQLKVLNQRVGENGAKRERKRLLRMIEENKSNREAAKEKKETKTNKKKEK